jgi:predicted metal-binding membrane protein
VSAPLPFLGIWTAMMSAMMLPSTLPLLRLDYAAARSPSRSAFVAGGYLAVWVAFGGLVLAVDQLGGNRLLGMHGRRFTAAALAVAALYQLLPFKQRCLTRCRAPLARVLRGWRDGALGAARLGIENGLACAGCRAGLMLALLGLGVMSVAWMVAIGLAILVEKTTPIGVAMSRIGAAALAAGAVAWAL